LEVVLRPVNDHFLREVVFPAFNLGVIDAAPGIEHLLRHLNDESTRVGLELLLEAGIDGSFFGLTDDKWTSTCYRLLFVEWLRDSEGWSLGSEYGAYAGDWEDTLHLCLMLEDPTYPYADAQKARTWREAFFDEPHHQFPLSTMICGIWDPVPDFPPDQILTHHGHGDYQPSVGIARADWSWRPMHVLNQWAAQLPNALSRLLQREAQRLKPVVAPERHEVLEYWLGRIAEPPVLAVSFSGLGPSAHTWIKEIGALARLIRTVAASEQGLTSVISFHGGEEGPFRAEP
jgi:hypothetical protein